MPSNAGRSWSRLLAEPTKDAGWEVEAGVLRARSHLARKEFAAAREILEAAITRAPREVHARVILTHVLLQEGRDDCAAEQALRGVLERDPQHTEAWRNLALLLNHQGRRETEGVEYIGSLAQPELARQLRSVSVLAYPCSFAETSCIAVLEAMASGCAIVTSDLAALPETTGGFAWLVPFDGDRPAYRDRFVEATVDVLKRLAGSVSADIRSRLRQQVAQVDAQCTWTVQANHWVRWLVRMARTTT